jgi:hypothetical protein
LVYILFLLVIKFVQYQHELPVYRYQRIDKTFEQLSRDYYFPAIKTAVEKVVQECNLYIKAKAVQYISYRLFKLLPVLKGAWKSIAIDFIVKLLLSKESITKEEFDSILVITDRLTKYRQFILYRKGSTAEEFVYIYLKNVVADYRISEEIYSDRDKLWISKFWRLLIAQLEVNYKLSTAYHPQTDRQTERLNQILEIYLCCYINYNQDNWVQLLLLVQFVYNSTKSEPIGILLFFANKGYNPEVYLQPRKDEVRTERATIKVNRIKEFQKQLILDLEFCISRYAEYTNKKQSIEPLLKKKDKVYLFRRYY